jgi:hypothetical protein
MVSFSGAPLRARTAPNEHQRTQQRQRIIFRRAHTAPRHGENSRARRFMRNPAAAPGSRPTFFLSSAPLARSARRTSRRKGKGFLGHTTRAAHHSMSSLAGVAHETSSCPSDDRSRLNTLLRHLLPSSPRRTAAEDSSASLESSPTMASQGCSVFAGLAQAPEDPILGVSPSLSLASLPSFPSPRDLAPYSISPCRFRA